MTTRRYNVGTLVMDVIDREKRQAVFQGGLEDVVTSKMMQDKEGTLNECGRGDLRQVPVRRRPVGPCRAGREEVAVVAPPRAGRDRGRTPWSGLFFG